MQGISPQRPVDASMIAPESLAANPVLTKAQKIAEASRQFEAILLRQILESSQKTVIQSKFSDNSASAAIYRDEITSQLADTISKTGVFGLAKTFEHQLSPPQHQAPATAAVAGPSVPPSGHAVVSHGKPTHSLYKTR